QEPRRRGPPAGAARSGLPLHDHDGRQRDRLRRGHPSAVRGPARALRTVARIVAAGRPAARPGIGGGGVSVGGRVGEGGRSEGVLVLGPPASSPAFSGDIESPSPVFLSMIFVAPYRPPLRFAVALFLSLSAAAGAQPP